MKSVTFIIALASIFEQNLNFLKYLKMKEENYSKRENSKYILYKNYLYKPPYLENKFYLNKTIPREKYSNKSLYGMKNKNLRKHIKKNLENKL